MLFRVFYEKSTVWQNADFPKVTAVCTWGGYCSYCWQHLAPQFVLRCSSLNVQDTVTYR